MSENSRSRPPNKVHQSSAKPSASEYSEMVRWSKLMLPRRCIATFCLSSQKRKSATVARSSGAAFCASLFHSAEYRNALILLDWPPLVLALHAVDAEAEPELTNLVF